MMVMLRGVELRRQMASDANRVQIFRRKRETVWIVTVRAGDTLVMHLALHERAVLVVLLLNLAVRKIDAVFEETREICIQKRFAGLKVAFDRMTPGMTGRAGLEFYPRAGVTFPACRAIG